jgi:hypothetical protein
VAGGTVVQAAAVANAADLAKEQEPARRTRRRNHLVSVVKTIVVPPSHARVVLHCGNGRQGLTTHIHEMALKNHPIRIGDEYKRTLRKAASTQILKMDDRS